VLSQSKKISLKITSNPSSGVAPTARLLNRTCCTAPAGLHLDLDLHGQDDVLAQLLEPALLQREGWLSVHKLVVSSDFSVVEKKHHLCLPESQLMICTGASHL
jgi:hypothetical protein